MRRTLLVLLLIAVPALAWPQATINKPKRQVIPPPTGALRAAQAPDAAPKALASAVPVRTAPPLPSLTDEVGRQCRSTCAQTYYFCPASGAEDDCGGAFSQCAAACDAPNLAVSAAGARGDDAADPRSR